MSSVALLTHIRDVKKIRKRSVIHTIVDLPYFLSASLSNTSLNHKNPRMLQVASIRYDSVDIASAEDIIKNRKNSPLMTIPIMPVSSTILFPSFLAFESAAAEV